MGVHQRRSTPRPWLELSETVASISHSLYNGRRAVLNGAQGALGVGDRLSWGTAQVTIEEQEILLQTVRVAEVKIRNFGDAKKMNAGALDLRNGDRVMIEINRELTYGVLTEAPQAVPFIPPMRMMKTILRKATDDDLATISRHEQLAREGRTYCRERAKAHGLEIKLVEVYASFERRVLTFVYTSEERIDFRQLVRDLARRFGGRIEMLHINAREEAKRLGGVDTCGLPLCCASFMVDFESVSVKKARAYGAQFDDSHLTGICGRLKCCLMFESADSPGLQSPSPMLITPIRRT